MTIDRPQGLIEGSGRRGEARRLDQMISVRLDPVLVAALRDLAAKRGVSLSDVLREAALLLLHREEAQNVITFRVNVTNERPAGITRESFDTEIKAAVLR
jgi:Arc/MetJ-type ribon-helix-helix transcriptional regulator